MALPQNFYDALAVFKQMYLPVWGNLIGTESSALISRVKNYQITGGSEIRAAAQVGFNGGFGALPDDLTAPQAGRNIYQDFTTPRKRMAVTLNISDESIQASANNKLAMVNLLDSEIKAGYETAKWNVGRSLFGNGLGILSPITSVSTGNVITLPTDGTETPNNIKEGLTIDVYASGAAVGATPTLAKRRIVSVNRTATPITFTVDGAPLGSAQTGGFITNQLSYGNEITGLGAIFDDSIPTLYGVSKSSVPLIKPVVEDGAGDINDSIITRTLRTAQREKGSVIDMLLMGDDAFDLYVEYLRTNNIRNEKTDLSITGGFSAIDFLFGAGHVAIVNEGFIPKDEVWGFDTKKLGFYQLADWDFVAEGGSAFTLMPGTLVYNAVIAKYGNLICTNPGGCVRIKNAA
jgi:hypothetical protein